MLLRHKQKAGDIRNLHWFLFDGGRFYRLLCCYQRYAHVRVPAQAVTAMVKSRTIKLILCVVFFTMGVFAQTVREKDDPQATKLVVLEHLWNEAQVNRDQRALEGMIADSFVDTEWDGDVSERGKFLADIKDPKFKPDLVTIQDLKVNLYHNAGVVTGVYHTKGSYNGKPYEHYGRFTDTWILNDGKWECVASHTSLLKK
jgi:hypothetical protein